MTRNKKRSVFVSLLILVMLLTSLTACKSKETSNGTNGGSDEKTNGETGTGSIENGSGEKETIEIALQTYSFITDYDDNYLTKKLEEELGINIEFNLLSADSKEAQTQLSLMIASNEEVSDVICTGSLAGEAIQQYGSNGVFIPLNDWIKDPEKAPNFNAIQSETDKASMIRSATSADGNIYGLTTFEPESWNMTPYRQYINEVWLKKLNLKMPTTTDEYYDVLKAFASKDPNENGIADEIPVYGITAGTYGENIIIPLMNSFIFYPSPKMDTVVLTLNDDGKTVMTPFVQEEWKAGLEYLNKLYSEGLLPGTVFTDDKTQFMAILNNEDVNLVGSLSSGSLSRWNDFDNNKNGQEYSMMPPLEGPGGKAYSPFLEYYPAQIWFITSSAENPELAFKLGDMFYRSDFSKVVRYGEEDVDWTTDKAKISNPEYSKAILNDIWGQNNNKFWRNINPRYAQLDDYNTWLTANSDPNAKSNIFRYVDNPKYNYPAHPANILPKLMYTDEEAQEQAEIIVNVSTYVSQSMAQFITGSRPFSDWDNYVKELDSMNLSAWLENAQAAFDRQK